ncbi:MAG: hypothetical protein SGPRY_004853 [Prymnesium sp.]
MAEVLQRSSRLSATQVVADTVLYARDADPSLSLPRNATFEVRGSGVVVCYSGLQWAFGEHRDGVLANHIQTILRPLAVLFPNQLHLAFDLVERSLRPEVMMTLMQQVQISPERVLAETRLVKNGSMALNGQGRPVIQKQFLGIEHCGRLIAQMQLKRGQQFSFAVRMRCGGWSCTLPGRSLLKGCLHPMTHPLSGRYDVVFSPELHLTHWPIWSTDVHTSPVLGLSKYITLNLTVSYSRTEQRPSMRPQLNRVFLSAEIWSPTPRLPMATTRSSLCSTRCFPRRTEYCCCGSRGEFLQYSTQHSSCLSL